MNITTFLQHFPEFRGTFPDYVQAKLDEATARMGGPVRPWPPYAATGQPLSLADIAQGNLAAHYLVCSPYGTETRLDPDTNDTTYRQKWLELCETVAGGVLVAGGRRPRGFLGWAGS